jgi:hypothetical protein
MTRKRRGTALAELRGLWDRRDELYLRRGGLDPRFLDAVLAWRHAEVESLPAGDRAAALGDLRRYALAGGPRVAR